MDGEWLSKIIDMVKQEGGDVPPEYRRYIKPEDLPKLPKNLKIYVGPKGGLYFDVREYRAIVGKDPDIGEVRIEEEGRAGEEFLRILRAKMEEGRTSVEITDDGWIKSRNLMFKITSDGRLVFKGDDKYVRVPRRVYDVLASELVRGTSWLSAFAKGSPLRKQIEKCVYERGVNEYLDSIEDAKRMIMEEFKPKYRDVGTKGKYSKKFGLKDIENESFMWLLRNGVIDYAGLTFARWWYNGQYVPSSIFATNMVEVFKGEFDENNMVHPILKRILETSRVSAEKFGAEYIYRGETNPEVAKAILTKAWSEGKVRIGGYMLSAWTENEGLAKWYAAEHTGQMIAEGKYTRTNVMLRLDKSRYLDKVVMDWRIWGDSLHPEMEITLCLDDVEISENDIFVLAQVSGRKKKWMTLKQYKDEGGKLEKLINQIKEWR